MIGGDQQVGMSEHDVALATTPAPEPQADPVSRLIDSLLELGVEITESKRPGVVAVLDAAFDESGSQRAVEALRFLLAKLGLDRTPTRRLAVQRVVTGDKTPLRDAAREIGVSHVALWKAERAVRKMLGGARKIS